MDAVVWKGKCHVEVERVPIPRLEDDGDAIVRIELAGLCGSDLHPYCCREEVRRAGRRQPQKPAFSPGPLCCSCSDLSVPATAGPWYLQGLDVGTIMGHEFVGRVVETGALAPSWLTGGFTVSATVC